MNPNHLLAIAMLALMLWTFGFTVHMGLQRYRAAVSRRVDPRFYRLFVGGGEPDDLVRLNRHYLNLHEGPLVFYALGLLTIALGVADSGFAILGWVYVAARGAHAIVHLGTDNVRLRFYVFGISTLLLAAIAIRLLLRLL